MEGNVLTLQMGTNTTWRDLIILCGLPLLKAAFSVSALSPLATDGRVRLKRKQKIKTTTALVFRNVRFCCFF